jgi:hypothetical protein
VPLATHACAAVAAQPPQPDTHACLQRAPIAIFVSTVPVILDTAFKWWLFKGLNRIDPSASVTLSEIDRH